MATKDEVRKAASILGKISGARAANEAIAAMTPEQRSANSRKAAKARWADAKAHQDAKAFWAKRRAEKAALTETKSKRRASAEIETKEPLAVTA